MKMLWKLLKNLIFGLLLLVAIYFSAAFILSYASTNPTARDCRPSERVYISSNGVHLFLVVPIDHLQDRFLEKLEYPANTKFVSFGWGEKTFYLNTPDWDDLTLPVAAKALLIPSESAMHISYYSTTWHKWEEVEICGEQSKFIADFVQDSFEETEGRFTPLRPKGYGPNNYFYEAKGKYTCIKTSNEWVNQALKQAQVETSIWSPMTFGVMHHVEGS